jgi:hypothetical protein
LRGQTLWLALAACAVSFAAAIGAYYANGYWQNLLLSVFGAFLSVLIALIVVNILLDRKSRKVAAGPLLGLVQDAIANFHNNYFMKVTIEHFGSADFKILLGKYSSNKANPNCFSPDERHKLAAMIEKNIIPMKEALSSVDDKLSVLVSVLGWSYDAKIIAAALTCKRNIAQFLSISNGEDADLSLRRTELYLDIDASAAAVIDMLANIYEEDVFVDEDPGT